MVLDVGPDRGGLATVALGLVGVVVRRGRGHVFDRDHDLEVPLLGRGRRDHLDRRRTAEEARNLLEGPHRGGEPDPLRRLGEQGVEPLEAEPQVGSALGAGHGVDLVDDHGLDVAQALAGLAGQHQEQRLGGRDQDVGRRARQGATLRGRGVTRPDADTDLRQPGAEALGGLPDADEGRAQVALDVDGKGLEGGDVEHARAGGVGCRLGEKSIDGPEERRQRLARTGRGDHERVLTPRDRVPRAVLRRGRLGEGRLEPRARGRAEALQRGVRLGHGVHPCSRHRQGGDACVTLARGTSVRGRVRREGG